MEGNTLIAGFAAAVIAQQPWVNETPVRWLMVIIVGIGGALILNRLITWTIPPLVRFVAARADNAEEAEKILRWRRLETFLSVILAAAKIVLSAVAIAVAWRLFNPVSSAVAVIGAGAVFAVLASATVGPLLRDLTYGIIMIAERWYNVGDYVAVEPFGEVKGVVEQVTLRSTKIRSLTGEIIWVHNQHIQGVRITPRVARTMAIEIFVKDLQKGRHVVEDALAMIPAGPTMAVRAFRITETEEVATGFWRITATGQIAPGREWLVEDFAVSAIKKHDDLLEGKDIIVHGPIVHYADDAAEKRFRRTVRVKNQS